MTLRYVDGIQVLSAGKLIKTIDRRPLRVLPDNSLGVTFGGRVYRLQHRRIELTGDAWRKVDTRSNCCASSATVFSPRSAAKATLP